MSNKKHIVNLEYFKETLQICPTLPDQQFEEPPFEEAILTFLRDLGHNGEIKMITDFNVNKLHQPWRSFATVISKCLSGKSTGYDSLQISQAQILWGMYHKKNVYYAYLLWEDLVYQVETKNAKRGNEMYYPRFTKVIINFFMTKDQSIPRRNKLYGAIFPNELKNEAIKDSESYKEYYAIASGAEPPKTKPRVKKKQDDKKKLPTQGLEALSEIALSGAEQIKLATKRSKIQFYSSHTSGSGVDKGTGVSPRVLDVPPFDLDDEQISWKSSDNKDDDDVNDQSDDDDGDSQGNDDQDDDDEQTESNNDDDDFVHPKLSTHDEEERHDDEDYDRDTKMTDIPQTNLKGTQVTEDAHVILTTVTPKAQQQSSSVSPGFISNMLNPNPDRGIDSILNLNTELTSLVDVLVTTNVEIPPSSATTLPLPPIPLIQPQYQTPTIVLTLSSIPGIVDSYLANKMNEAVKTDVQLQLNELRDKAQAKNKDFINKLDENIKKIIKEQVKVKVKEQVNKILLKIEKFVNDQLESEVLTHSSSESKTSYAVAASLSELELKKILIDKMESNKSIHRSVQQKTLYKALTDAYETNKGSKRRRAGKEPESTSEPKEKTSKSSGKSKEGSKSHHMSISKSVQVEEPIHADKNLKEPTHQEFDIGFTKDQPVDETTQHPDCNLAQKEDTRISFNELMDTPLDFLAFDHARVWWKYLLEEVCKATTDKLDWNNPEGQQYPHDLRKPLPLIPNSQGRRVIPFDHFINNDLAYLRGGSSSRTYATSVTKTKAADYGHVKWIEDLVSNTMWSPVPVIYDKHALWGISYWGRKHQQFYGLLSIETLLVITPCSECVIANVYKMHCHPKTYARSSVSDDTPNDVRTALDDILKRIRMQYLPWTLWKKVDKDRVGAMIQAIDKRFKNRRIMRRLEKFVVGRPYEGDFQLMQRTI
uniref:Monodehydroascorbate reductase n=1 Tax=Tanacetum cinerariifolium TaxID=118510 RepID=A0A699H2K7_TANCI|nr:hypothetical protein [Tanacetum cinerariifolium]